MTSEVGSFAQETIMHRKPKIIEEVIAENNYPSLTVERLTSFKDEILHGKVRPLTENARDVKQWSIEWQEFQDKTWLQLPWYFAEAYFYRRLLEAVEYFQAGPLHRRDPFQQSKSKQLEESIVPLSTALSAIETITDTRLRFENLLHASLWGNRIDLSNITVADDVRRRQGVIERQNLLIDEFSKVFEVFEEWSVPHIAFINDNMGMELGFDLSLADFLLRNGWAEKITFFLKPYPFFVSDAMPKDLRETLRALADTSSSSLRQLGKRMHRALMDEKLCLSAGRFWASYRHFCEMPRRLCEEISRFDLVFLKGDVNYRRLLSDRHWPYTMPIKEIVKYFPSSLLILRTLKGEIVVGLEEGQAQEIEADDPKWLVNGQRGIIQYVEH